MKVGDLVKHRAEYKLTGTIMDVVDMDDTGMLYKVFWLNSGVETWEEPRFIRAIDSFDTQEW